MSSMGTGFRYPLSMIDVAKNIIVMIAFVVSILRGRYYNGIVKVTDMLTSFNMC